LALFDSLIQGLQDTRIHRGDDIHCGIQFFLRHPRFPCVRKAPVYSRIAKPHHCHGKTHEHLFPLGETFHSMGVTIKGTKISFLQFRSSFLVVSNSGLIEVPWRYLTLTFLLPIRGANSKG
jgi:hypothetical protein